MQVPTSQQKEGIYDVPKRHFMTVGVFLLFVFVPLFISVLFVSFLLLLRANLSLPSSPGEAVKVSHPLRPPTDVC